MSDEQRYSVKEWRRDALQAARMSVGRCQHGDTIGVDMYAQDGVVFAHGHFDVETAYRFALALNAALDEAYEEMTNA